MTLSQSLSMFGNILCVLCRVLVQIWSAARTANCCWVSGKRREAARLATELQGISVVTVRRYVELYKGQNVWDVLFVSMRKDMSCVMLVQDVMSC